MGTWAATSSGLRMPVHIQRIIGVIISGWVGGGGLGLPCPKRTDVGVLGWYRRIFWGRVGDGCRRIHHNQGEKVLVHDGNGFDFSSWVSSTRSMRFRPLARWSIRPWFGHPFQPSLLSLWIFGWLVSKWETIKHGKIRTFWDWIDHSQLVLFCSIKCYFNRFFVFLATIWFFSTLPQGYFYTCIIYFSLFLFLIFIIISILLYIKMLCFTIKCIL